MRYLAGLIALWSAMAASGQSPTLLSVLVAARDNQNGKLTNERFWNALGISPAVRRTSARGITATFRRFDCNPCSAQLLAQTTLESLDDSDELLKVSNENETRLLLIHNQDGISRLVDYLDAEMSEYAPPEFSIYSSAGRTFVQITTFPRGGTGLADFPADWYEVHESRFRWVLRVPQSGNQANADPARDWSASFVGSDFVHGVEILKFAYSAQFGSGFSSGGAANEIDLWNDERAVAFSRQKGQTLFKFDGRRSNTTKEFVDFMFSEAGDVYDFPEEQSRFYRLLSDHLLEIARNPRDPRREWLRQLLERKRDVPTLKPVREAFVNAR
jgi:hypothetical protein